MARRPMSPKDEDEARTGRAKGNLKAGKRPPPAKGRSKGGKKR